MRILFFGATDLGYQCCQRLFEMGEHVVGVFTIPQEFRISYSPTPVRNVTFRDFEDLAKTYNVPVMRVTMKMTDAQYTDAVRKLGADIGLVIGWYYMIPRNMRELFPQGIAGIHASLLPKYRGGAPLVWAILNGETKTGVTLFQFDDGVDTGPIIGQREFTIDQDDTIKTVYDKASQASLDVLHTHIPKLSRGVALRIPQDHAAATQFPQRSPEDGLIDWHLKSAKQVYDWVRAQTRPYPGAYTYLAKDKVTIWCARLTTEQGNAKPGTVITNVRKAERSLGVVCADRRFLMVDEVGLSDGSTMTGAEFIRARQVGEGEVFAAPQRPRDLIVR